MYNSNDNKNSETSWIRNLLDIVFGASREAHYPIMPEAWMCKFSFQELVRLDVFWVLPELWMCIPLLKQIIKPYGKIKQLNYEDTVNIQAPFSQILIFAHSWHQHKGKIYWKLCHLKDKFQFRWKKNTD